MSLEEAVQRSMLPDGLQLPRIIRECIMQIEDKGLSEKSNIYNNRSQALRASRSNDSYSNLALCQRKIEKEIPEVLLIPVPKAFRQKFCSDQ